MPTSLLAFQIFLVLMPGFTSAYIVQALATRRTQSDFERTIEGFVFSFFIYLCDLPFNRGQLPFAFQHSVTAPGQTSDSIAWNLPQIACLALVTLAFSLLTIIYIRYDGNRIFQLCRLTERTTRNSIWNDVLESESIPGQPLQVELADGRSVLGKLLYYSDMAEDSSLFLTEALWVDQNGLSTTIKGSGILLTKSSGIRSISLLDPEDIEVSAEDL